jgi:alpha-ketoglutarate-dependent taurine dioxygenase
MSDLKTKIARDGYAFMPAYRAAVSTTIAAAELGQVLVLPGVTETQVLRPRHRLSSPPNIYSGNFGMEEFPLHTDLAHWAVPPAYFLLRAVTGSDAVTNRLVDTRALVETVGELTLRRGLVRPRRKVNGTTTLLRLLERRHEDMRFIRWDELFIVPASRSGAEACRAVAEYLARAEPTELTLRNAGDTLVVDNTRILHGRSAVPESAGNRHIERAYLSDIL